MTIIISKVIGDKLANKHGVTRKEVEQCFENLLGTFILETREKHRSDPPTMWFISTTNKDRLLKVAFVKKDGNFYIRTAYEPNIDEINIYIGE